MTPLRLGERNRRWWVLAGACAGLFVLMLDSTVVNLALPAIQGDLGASASELQWVVNAYLLVMAATVVTAGRIGDITGRKRVFQAGMVLFVAGSVTCGLAPSPLVLIGGRAVQALGAAGLLSLSLAIVAHEFPEEERPRALGIWAGVSAVALAVGPVVGGFLVQDVSWRGIFWLNVPVGIAGVIITAAAVRESRDETAGHHLDLPGLVTLGAGLTALVLGLVEAPDWGWGSPATLGAIAGGLALLGAFCVIEQRVSQPIVEFPLFRSGPYFGASVAGFTLVGAYWGLMFYEPQYLQNVIGHSALQAGLLILPITVPMVVISPFTGRLSAALGVRRLITLGMALGTAGVALLTQVATDSGYGLVLAGYLLFGIALGLVYATMSTAAMEALPPEKAGIASGVLAMNRLMAGTLVLAGLGALVQHLEQGELTRQIAEGAPGVTVADRGELDGLLAGANEASAALAGQPASVVAEVRAAAAEAFTYALGHALWAVVALLAAGAALTAIFVRDAHAPAATARAPAHHRHRHRVPL